MVPPPRPGRGAAHGLKPGQEVWYYPRRGFDLWNTRYFIVPGRLVWGQPARGYAALIPHSTFIYPAPGTFDGPDGPARRAKWLETDDFRILRNEAAFPRAWVVHRAYLLPTVHGLRLVDRLALTQQILYQGDEFWRVPGLRVCDLHSVAWVETDRPKEVDRFLSRAAPDPAETVTVTRDEPQRVELTAVLRSAGPRRHLRPVLPGLEPDRRRAPRRDPPDQPGDARGAPRRRHAPARLPLRPAVVSPGNRPFLLVWPRGLIAAARPRAFWMTARRVIDLARR